MKKNIVLYTERKRARRMEELKAMGLGFPRTCVCCGDTFYSSKNRTVCYKKDCGWKAFPDKKRENRPKVSGGGLITFVMPEWAKHPNKAVREKLEWFAISNQESRAMKLLADNIDNAEDLAVWEKENDISGGLRKTSSIAIGNVARYSVSVD